MSALDQPGRADSAPHRCNPVQTIDPGAYAVDGPREALQSSAAAQGIEVTRRFVPAVLGDKLDQLQLAAKFVPYAPQLSGIEALDVNLSLIHISEPTRPPLLSRMPSSA